jgi:protease secretion system outer membrane protein
VIRICALICIGSCAAAAAAQPVGLFGSFEAAALHDPAYRAALAELEAAQQAVPIARAALLPSVNATISDARVDGARVAPGIAGPQRSQLDYRAPNYALSVRVPLINAEAWARERQARAQVEQAQRVHEARRLELLDRLAAAWFNAIQAEGQLRWAGDPVQAARIQREQAASRLKAGEATLVEVAEAQAALAGAQASEDSAQDGVKRARLALAQLTGAASVALPGNLGETRSDNHAPPSWAGVGPSLAEWVGLAAQRSPALAARRAAIEAAQAVARRAEAGHLPRIEAVISASASRNESVSTLGQSVNQRVWSAQLNVPLYGGGQVMASVAQAAAELRRAQAELDAERQTLEREVTRQYLLRTDQARRLSAQRLAVAAASLAMRGTELAAQSGLASAGDVAQASRRLAQERQTLIEVDAAGWLAWIRLQALAGEAPERIAAGVDAALLPDLGDRKRPSCDPGTPP